MLLLAAPILIYCFAAVGFALLPLEGRAQLTKSSDPPLYVCTSPVHTDIVLPLFDNAFDWPSVFGKEAWRQLPKDTHLAIGWGDLVFFTEVPDWSDLTPGIFVSAVSGQNPTALRVMPVRRPRADGDCKTLSVDEEGRLQIFAHVLESLRGQPSGPREAAYLDKLGEIYFLARGSYSPFRTCNQWTADALAAAGLPHAWFAPFSFGVTWPLAE